MDRSTVMVSPGDALPGRPTALPIAPTHAVLGTPTHGPWPDGAAIASFGMGCFWGAERIFWQIDGVISTSAGYQAGFTPNPTYEEVCSGRTGHAEVVRVVWDPTQVSFDALLGAFWENHDPTQLMGQGNDIGTQYRSCVIVSPDLRADAEASKARYQDALTTQGFSAITTEIIDLADAGPFFFAEGYHQGYLHKNPGGYCNHGFCQVAYATTAP